MKGDIDKIIQAVLDGASSIEDVAKTVGIELDESHKTQIDTFIKKRNEFNENTRSQSHEFSTSNPYTKKKDGKDAEEQTHLHDAWDILSQEPDIKLDVFVLLSKRWIPDENDIHDALDTISMPWKTENNWRSYVHALKKEDNSIYLSLQKNIPAHMREAIVKYVEVRKKMAADLYAAYVKSLESRYSQVDNNEVVLGGNDNVSHDDDLLTPS